MTAFTGSTFADPTAKVSAFEVQDPKSHAPVLRIEERSSQDGPDLVQERLFRAPNNEPAGSETVRLGGPAQLLISYVYDDLHSGEHTELKVDGDKATARFRAHKDAEVKTKALAWPANALTGNLLPALIGKHWSALDGGQTIPVELFVPFRLETIAFRLQRTAVNASDKTVVITAEASNWLIRQFAPAISFVYSADAHLLKYMGPAPVQIGEEKIKAVEIDFRAAPLAAR